MLEKLDYAIRIGSTPTLYAIFVSQRISQSSNICHEKRKIKTYQFIHSIEWINPNQKSIERTSFIPKSYVFNLQKSRQVFVAINYH